MVPEHVVVALVVALLLAEGDVKLVPVEWVGRLPAVAVVYLARADHAAHGGHSARGRAHFGQAPSCRAQAVEVDRAQDGADLRGHPSQVRSLLAEHEDVGCQGVELQHLGG